jgi:hypothetical protein
MRSRRIIARRSVLLTAAVAGFGGGVVSVASDDLAAAAHRLRAMAQHPLSARHVGALYLARFPDEADRGVLTERILAALELPAAAVLAQDEQCLRTAIAARVRRDFAETATAEIEGWILSRTEARLCALWA